VHAWDGGLGVLRACMEDLTELVCIACRQSRLLPVDYDTI
jgi:hypothetical protein